jgi:hypothetical protein
MVVRKSRHQRGAGALALTAILALLAASAARAFDNPKKVELPPRLRQALEKLDSEKYRIVAEPLEYSYGESVRADLKGWPAFQERFGREWRLEVDRRTGAPLLIEGQGIPLFPGRGNSLERPAYGSIAAVAPKDLRLEDVAAVTRAFLDQNAELLGVAGASLQLDKRASSALGRDRLRWNIRFEQFVRDPALGTIPVRDAHVFFRISGGNLLQFGNQFVTAVRALDTSGLVSRQQAMEAARALTGDGERVRVEEPGRDIGQQDRTLQIVLVNGPRGTLEHQLVRSVLVDSSDFNFELWFDAKSGKLVHAIDRRHYVDGTVRGGIYPLTNSDPEVVRSMPFLGLVNTGNKTTDVAGVYDYAPPASLATATLDGPTVTINDNCGASSLGTSLDPGDLNFGTGAGTDCDTPGFGGAGNTHSARSTFYHVNLIQEKGRAFVGFPWLSADLTANLNINLTCNAFWNGSTINFYRSGGGCSNTGEIAAVFLHEWGHGLQANTTGIPDRATGEAFADVESFLETHASCIGDNFRPGVPCSFGCGPDCTGVRDVDVSPNVSPATIEQPPADCDAFGCPHFYTGIMGYQGHCESLISSGAFWDMAQGFVGRYNSGAGWALADRIWYESLGMTGNAYQVTAGGQCNPGATVNGCGAGNWYTVFRFLDDDNSNLADGTPNSDIIWNAFNSHGIACGAAPPVNTVCSPLTAPALAATPGAGQVDLSWTAVPGAASYRIFRNEFGCGWGFVPIAEVAAPATNYTDAAVNGFTTYYYAAQVVGTNVRCVSEFSACTNPAPGGPPAPSGTGLEFGPYLGWFFLDSSLPIDDGPVVGARLSLDVGGPWSVETELGATFTDDMLGDKGVVLQISENGLFHLTPRPQPVEWFVTAGVGALVFTGFSDDDARFALNFGGGVKIDLAPATDLRIDLRDYIADDAYNAGTTHNPQLTVGVVWKVP